MKAAILVLAVLLGVLCVYSHNTPHPHPANSDSVVAVQPEPGQTKKVHNRVRITFDKEEHNGWMFDCPTAALEDSPLGCSTFPHEVTASNSTKAKQICSRKCKLTPTSNVLLAIKELKHTVHIDVSSFDQPHAHHAKCELTWAADKHLAGYDLQVHYLWVDHIEVPFIEIKSCQAVAIESDTPLKTGEMFVDSRELILDEKINFLATVLLLTLMALALTLCCCACTFCVTCLCFKVCGKSEKRAARKAREDVENLEMEEMPQGKAVDASAPQVPVYIPYYMINPYSAPMFLGQQQGENTYVMPNAPQQL